MKRSALFCLICAFSLVAAACGSREAGPTARVVTSIPFIGASSTPPPTPPLVFPTLIPAIQIIPTKTPEKSGTPTYDTDIQPVFQAQCTPCHGDDKAAGLRLTVYGEALAGSDNGPVITAGDSSNSKLIQVQSGDHEGKLTSEEMELVKQWIDAGAPEK